MGSLFPPTSCSTTYGYSKISNWLKHPPTLRNQTNAPVTFSTRRETSQQPGRATKHKYTAKTISYSEARRRKNMQIFKSTACLWKTSSGAEFRQRVSNCCSEVCSVPSSTVLTSSFMEDLSSSQTELLANFTDFPRLTVKLSS